MRSCGGSLVNWIGFCGAAAERPRARRGALCTHAPCARVFVFQGFLAFARNGGPTNATHAADGQAVPEHLAQSGGRRASVRNWLRLDMLRVCAVSRMCSLAHAIWKWLALSECVSRWLRARVGAGRQDGWLTLTSFEAHLCARGFAMAGARRRPTRYNEWWTA